MARPAITVPAAPVLFSVIRFGCFSFFGRCCCPLSWWFRIGKCLRIVDVTTSLHCVRRRSHEMDLQTWPRSSSPLAIRRHIAGHVVGRAVSQSTHKNSYTHDDGSCFRFRPLMRSPDCSPQHLFIIVTELHSARSRIVGGGANARETFRNRIGSCS